MGVLVGVGDPGLDIQARVRHDDHPLLDVVVEPEHLVAEQLELQLGDILVGLQQAERAQRVLSRSRSSGGYSSSNSCWSSTASSSRVMMSGGPISAASRPRMPMTCSSISSRTAWISASLGAEGCPSARRCRAGRGRSRRGLRARIGGDARARDVEAQDHDAPITMMAEDEDQAVGSGIGAILRSPAGGLNVQVS